MDGHLSRLLLWFCVFGPLTLPAQWNAIAGYDFSGVQVAPFNQVLEDFNEAYEPTVSFSRIRVLHGFTAGVRYNYPVGAFELVYNRRFSRRIGDRFLVDENLGRTDANFFYEIRTFRLTTEFGGTIRIGGSLDYNTYFSEMAYLTTSYKDVKIRQRVPGSQVFLGVNIRDRPTMSITMRAYYQWSWKAITTTELRESLGIGLDPCSECRHKPGSLGISIIINNGRP